MCGTTDSSQLAFMQRHKSASSVLTHELKVQDVTGSDPLARGAEVAYNTQPPTTNQPRVHLTEQQVK